MTTFVLITSIFLSQNIKMCNTCSLGQVKFVAPISSLEVYHMCKRCPSCGKLVIWIEKNKFPSLISSWKILTPSSIPWEPMPNIIEDVFIIV